MSKTDLVILELDRPRELRFGIKALKMIEAMFEKSLYQIVQDGLENIKADTLSQILHMGLIGDDGDLKFDECEALLDKICYTVLMKKMIDAFNKTYGVEEIKEEEKDVERFKKPEDNKKK